MEAIEIAAIWLIAIMALIAPFAARIAVRVALPNGKVTREPSEPTPGKEARIKAPPIPTDALSRLLNGLPDADGSWLKGFPQTPEELIRAITPSFMLGSRRRPTPPRSEAAVEGRPIGYAEIKEANALLTIYADQDAREARRREAEASWEAYEASFIPAPKGAARERKRARERLDASLLKADRPRRPDNSRKHAKRWRRSGMRDAKRGFLLTLDAVD